MQAPTNLLIPEGINYECTGCGICCSGWAVPMTPTDYERISNVDWSKKLDKFLGLTLYRPLKKYEAANTPYTMAMNPGPDDYCPFLVDKLCFIHKENGSEFKPSMCQLFPYCFNETPSGIYVTVSFVSMAVVYNSGKALSQQREWLEKKFGDFCKLYPDHHPNWSQLKLTTGVPLDWDTYLSLEAHLINCLNDRSITLEERFIAGSNHLLKYMRSRLSSSAQENTATDSGTVTKEVPLGGPSKLNNIDQTLLTNLHKLYFPAKAHIRGEHNFSVVRFATEAMSGTSKFSVPGQSFNLQELTSLTWPGDRDLEDLLYRYFFSRVFSKLYFGAGMGQLSLIVGFHHLGLLLSLTKLQARGLALARGAPCVSMIDLVAAIRQLEKRLGDTALGPYAAATFELLLFSPSRLKRIFSVCS